jgi:hypothetical protein
VNILKYVGDDTRWGIELGAGAALPSIVVGHMYCTLAALSLCPPLVREASAACT